LPAMARDAFFGKFPHQHGGRAQPLLAVPAWAVSACWPHHFRYRTPLVASAGLGQMARVRVRYVGSPRPEPHGSRSRI
jgi:hypothetical protein